MSPAEKKAMRPAENRPAHAPQAVYAALPRYVETLEAMREIFLANLIMIAEIPAPTFQEQARTDFLLQRFAEAGLDNSSSDEAGNALGILPGEEPDRNILVVAHADTVFPATVNHTVQVEPDRMAGPGIGDNSLGLAAAVSLPRILNVLDIRLRSNLILMGASQSLGRGNLNGLKFFLSNKETPILAGLCVEGMQLGRLSYETIGMSRGEIRCSVPLEYDWTQFGVSGAIAVLNDIISGMLAIPTPRRPHTQLILGQIDGGSSFNRLAHHARLRYELQSEDNAMLERVEKQIENIVSEVHYKTHADIHLDVVARREKGGLDFNHPLVQTARDILASLHVEPAVEPSTSELSAFIDAGIPAITIGLTQGRKIRESNETVMIEPIFTGLAQLIGLLQAIDGGCCDAD